jgi:hypothetical protein
MHVKTFSQHLQEGRSRRRFPHKRIVMLERNDGYQLETRQMMIATRSLNFVSGAAVADAVRSFVRWRSAVG